MSFQLSSVRLGDHIDVYVTEMNGVVRHYWTSPRTKWTLRSETLAQAIVGKPACLRTGDRLDVYVRTTRDELLHLWHNDPDKIFYQSEVLAHDAASSPVATGNGSCVNVFYFNKDNILVNLCAKQSNDLKYKSIEILESSNPSNICVVGNASEKIDLFFREERNIVHVYIENEGIYTHEKILSDVASFKGEICATCSAESINLFFVDEDKRICHAVGSKAEGWKIVSSIKGSSPKNGALSVVQFGDHVDLYFIKHDNRVYHGFYESSSNLKWTLQAISNADATQPTSISALRPHEQSIDVFYIDKESELKHMYTGERTNFDWNEYRSGVSLPIIEWETIETNAKLLGQGLVAKTYLFEQGAEKLVAKKWMENRNSGVIKLECEFLLRLNPVEPNFSRALLHEAGKLVGFVMPYFDGEVLEDILQDQNGVYFNSPSARVNLIRAIGLKLRKIQNQGVCHSDLNPGNVIIHHSSEDGSDPSATIIDFGCAFTFNSFVRFRSMMAGMQFLKPPVDEETGEYDRSGVNAYQLARLALLILLRTPRESYTNLSNSPDPELEQLERLGYDKSLLDFLKKGLSNDVTTRNSFLDTIDSLSQLKIDDSKIKN